MPYDDTRQVAERANSGAVWVYPQPRDLIPQMTFAIDFDGTIAEHEYPSIGDAVPGAFLCLDMLRRGGAKLILWTMRSGDRLRDAVEFCRKNGFEFDSVNGNPDQSAWTDSPKCFAHAYIDDAALGCPLIKNPRIGGRPYVNWNLVGQTAIEMLQVWNHQ